MRVGILGGGQLARMLAEAGLPLGLEFRFLDPKPEACVRGLGELLTARFDDHDALAQLADCDRITCDFENVPASSLEFFEGRVAVRPSPAALAAGQDRLDEKRLFQALGMRTPGFRAVDSRPELGEAIEALGLPAVLKTRRLGYDGKGQAILRDAEDLELAWQAIGGPGLILEQWVDFDFECAMTAVRAATGEIRCYPLTRTVHRDGILALAHAPLAPSDAGAIEAQARAWIGRLAEHLDYVGCLSLELFACAGRLLANEFAPRVHNSAHWTIEAAVCSQFENHLRAVCDWPLGETAATGSATMFNFIGELPYPHPWLGIPGLHWHDYRKVPRADRKLGHATLVAADPAALQAALAQLGAATGLVPPAGPGAGESSDWGSNRTR